MNEKKKIILVIEILALSIFACGCGRKSVTNEQISLIYNNKSYDGIYTGDMLKDNPIGEGIFIADDGWSAEGNFDNEVFNGKVSDFPIVLNYNNVEYEGEYTGEVQDNQISGTGSFEKDDWKYNGKFLKDTFSGEGKLENYPYEIEYQDLKYVGKYTGKSTELLPNGEGEFSGENDEYKFTYTGTWKNGEISGEGSLNHDGYMIHFKSVDRIGKYKGEVVDGLPCGTGSFTAVNSDGNKYVYEGEFKEGIFNGQGSKVFKEGYKYSEIGNFKDGEFTPDVVDGLNALGSYEDCNFSVNEKTAKFIKKNLQYITGSDFEKKDLNKLINKKLTYSNYVKQPSKYLNKMISWKGYEMTQVWIYDFFDKKDECMEIIAQDDNGHVLRIFSIGEIADGHAEYFAEGNNIDVIGIPLGSTSYENISGGYTNCVVMLLSWYDITY